MLGNTGSINLNTVMMKTIFVMYVTSELYFNKLIICFCFSAQF